MLPSASTAVACCTSVQERMLATCSRHKAGWRVPQEDYLFFQTIPLDRLSRLHVKYYTRRRH